jgi:acylphosphatase
MSMDRLEVIFHGKVQGVWFRANCQKKAIELGLKGWVKNMPDGSVKAVVEGSRPIIEEHLEWNKHQQPYARVRDVEIKWGRATGEFSGFSIIR